MDNSVDEDDLSLVSSTEYDDIRSAVIFLRETSSTPDQLRIVIHTPGGEVSYEVETIKLTNYFTDTLFKKILFFLLPFLLFMYYRRVEKYKK